MWDQKFKINVLHSSCPIKNTDGAIGKQPHRPTSLHEVREKGAGADPLVQRGRPKRGTANGKGTVQGGDKRPEQPHQQKGREAYAGRVVRPVPHRIVQQTPQIYVSFLLLRTPAVGTIGTIGTGSTVSTVSTVSTRGTARGALATAFLRATRDSYPTTLSVLLVEFRGGRGGFFLVGQQFGTLDRFGRIKNAPFHASKRFCKFNDQLEGVDASSFARKTGVVRDLTGVWKYTPRYHDLVSPSIHVSAGLSVVPDVRSGDIRVFDGNDNLPQHQNQSGHDEFTHKKDFSVDGEGRGRRRRIGGVGRRHTIVCIDKDATHVQHQTEHEWQVKQKVKHVLRDEVLCRLRVLLAFVLNGARPEPRDFSPHPATDQHGGDRKQRAKNDVAGVRDKLLHKGLKVEGEWFFRPLLVPVGQANNALFPGVGDVGHVGHVAVDESGQERLRGTGVVVVFGGKTIVQGDNGVFAGAVRGGGWVVVVVACQALLDRTQVHCGATQRMFNLVLVDGSLDG